MVGRPAGISRENVMDAIGRACAESADGTFQIGLQDLCDRLREDSSGDTLSMVTLRKYLDQLEEEGRLVIEPTRPPRYSLPRASNLSQPSQLRDLRSELAEAQMELNRAMTMVDRAMGRLQGLSRRLERLHTDREASVSLYRFNTGDPGRDGRKADDD